ncbi:hypothetical protein [Rhizobium laguerreae]|uniref:hypothetical protein n=1 Tax=Rhizobium laguerreae TaxID=1076926 RepID=UPI0014426737|nr:hypothetical protein [Rhizobium laguerreae]NKN10768.1 hypothetical protein [Rhizobium laguerreae]
MPDHYDTLLHEITERLPDAKVIAIECTNALQPSMAWIAYYLHADQHNPANKICESAYSAGVEAVTLISLSMLRSAVYSLRSHYEFYLMYLYYKDHPIELEACLEFRNDFLLPGKIKEYFKLNFENYGKRIESTNKNKSRDQDDYYKVLSSVAHGSAINSQPTALEPKEILFEKASLETAVNIFKYTSENLSDYSIAIFPSNWASLPEITRQNLTLRMGVKSRSELKFA